MKENFIFDLYGTLVHIRTNENKLSLWRKMAEIYQAYGIIYQPKQLKKAYGKVCALEEEKLSKLTDLPEIDLINVFIALAKKAPQYNDLYREEKIDDSWAYMMANTFRVLSREIFETYPGVEETLKVLKQQGKKIYLLSNAQASFTLGEIEALGLTKYFDALYLSSQEGIKKPNVDFMKRLLQQQKLKTEQCVMVGNDFSSDIKIAQDCQMDAVFLNTDGYSHQQIEDKLSRLQADAVTVIESGKIEEILSLI